MVYDGEWKVETLQNGRQDSDPFKMTKKDIGTLINIQYVCFCMYCSGPLCLIINCHKIPLHTHGVWLGMKRG